MEELQLGDQMGRYDREATMTAYALMAFGDADRCGCVYCRNFAVQRDTVYPSAFRGLLSEIGIDPNKEGEVYDMAGPCDLRIRPTGGWFYFVGELTQPGEKLMQAGEFQYWLQPSFPRPPVSFGENVAAIEFSVKVPWVLYDDPYESVVSRFVRYFSWRGSEYIDNIFPSFMNSGSAVTSHALRSIASSAAKASA